MTRFDATRARPGIDWFGGLSLDLKLGYRMLVKYPGLTVVGGLAMAFGIWFGAVSFEMYGLLNVTALPLPDGDRIVKIQSWDAQALQEEDRVLYDYQLWQSGRSITDLGAWRDASVNLVGADGIAQPAVAAEVTAAAFRIAPERPLLGRALDEEDERTGAAPVVVLGYDVWARRFGGDPAIIGRSVQIGDGFATVVGVMPQGYAFPVSHELWLPLRTDVAAAQPRSGIAINVFGRLASGATLESAQAEFTALGERLALEHPGTHTEIRPYVLPYTQFSVDNDDVFGMMALTNVVVIMMVLIVCSTVGLLLFARTAARESELLVRSALGASRRRLVTQLFLEALVLAGVAAGVGLGAAQFALTRWGRPYFEVNYGNLPFWYDFNLSPATILYALALALLGAVVAGVMPARKITRELGARLRAGTAGGGGASFGGVWTAVIVTQVAFTVLLPSVALIVRGEVERVRSFDPGFPAQEYLGVTIAIDESAAESGTAEPGARIGASLEELRRQLEQEPGVTGVTFVDALPRDDHAWRSIELESRQGQRSWVSTASIDPRYFSVLQVPPIAGRAFTSADLSPDVRVLIVDQGFADRFMAGGNPVGHRVRFPVQTDSVTVAERPWYEIVGLVRDLGMASAAQSQRAAGLYVPASAGDRGVLEMIVHAPGDPLALAPRVRRLATEVDPNLRIEQITRLDHVVNPLLWFLGLWLRIVFGLIALFLLLSLAGIYAVLSFLVARRTREIGVRVALGATAHRVITAIFRRPTIQVAMGVLAGCVLIALAAMLIQNTTQFAGTGIGGLEPRDVVVLTGYAVLMFGVCALACVVPTIRALRVQPVQALKAE